MIALAVIARRSVEQTDDNARGFVACIVVDRIVAGSAVNGVDSGAADQDVVPVVS